MRVLGSSLRELSRLRDAESHRASSWDRTGGNTDCLHLEPGQTATLMDYQGAGCITHFWSAVTSEDPLFLRKVVLRMWWDDESTPSVEAPVGDLFGLGHARVTYFNSLPLQMFYRGFNCWFPMPFARRARVTVQNEADVKVRYFHYLDYETYDRLPDGEARFHAQWRRENPTVVNRPDATSPEGRRLNLTGQDNYLILEAVGRGHYVGCHLDVDMPEPGWWGEGDDMFFIDGEPWPPRLHGTGTEDYFGGAWDYNYLKQTYNTPYFGYHLKTGDDYPGKHSQYRFHVEDPVHFKTSLRVTIEHGHANDKQGDWSSTAYWYQTEPHLAFPTLPPVERRLPRA